MPIRAIDVHAHVLFPEVMGICSAAGPELGVRDGVQFFRPSDYVLENVRFVSPISTPWVAHIATTLCAIPRDDA